MSKELVNQQYNMVPICNSPFEAEQLLDQLINNGFEINGLTTDFSDEQKLDLEFDKKIPDVLQAKGRFGEIVLLPLYAVLAVRERIFGRAIFFPAFDYDHYYVETPKPIINNKDHDPAHESSISLFDLATFLEVQKGSSISPKTVVFYLFVRHIQSIFPKLRNFNAKITRKKLEKRISGGSHYYDCLGVETGGQRRKKSFYPLPAFWNGAFGISEDASISIEDQADFFLTHNYADRVVFLPRVRSRQGRMKTELPESLSWAASILNKSLFNASNEELIKAGILFKTS